MSTNRICTLCIVVVSLLPLVRTAHAQNDKVASEQKSAGDIARLLSAFELEKLHAKVTDDKRFSAFNENLAKAMIPDDFGYSWKTNIIRRDQLNEPLSGSDDLKRQVGAVLSLSKDGNDEVFEVQKDGIIRFARAVRTLDKSCAACHNSPGDSKLEPTRIIGIVYLEISPKDKKP